MCNPLVGTEPDPPIQKVTVAKSEKTHSSANPPSSFHALCALFLGLYHVPLFFRASCTEAQVLGEQWSDSGEKLKEKVEAAILQEPPNLRLSKSWQFLEPASGPE